MEKDRLLACWAAPHRPASLVVAQPRDQRKNLETMTETSTVYGMGALTRLKQKVLGQHSTANSRQRAERRLPFIRGIDVMLARQLPGKPAPGAGGKHVGSY